VSATDNGTQNVICTLGSEIKIGGLIIATNSTVAENVMITDNSSVTIGTDAIFNSSTVECLRMETSSSLVIRGSLTAKGSTTTNLDVGAGCLLHTQKNLTADQSATGYNLNCNGGRVIVGGTANFADGARGCVLLQNDAVGTFMSDLNANSSGGHGVHVLASTLVVAGAAVANNNVNNGIEIERSTADFGGDVDVGRNSNGFSTVRGSTSTIFGIFRSSAGANLGIGNGVGFGSKLYLQNANGPVQPTVFGVLGECKVGTNPVTTWAAIAIRAPAVVTDFFAPATQLCQVSYEV